MKPDRKQISTALIEHLEREELHSGEAARYLNLNPCYVSMAKSEKSWNAMSNIAWDRLAEWFNTRENIKDFQIPKGEEIFRKPERDPSTRITEPNIPKTQRVREPKEVIFKATHKDIAEAAEEHSPENLIPEIPVEKKEKNGKSVKLIIKNAEIDALRKDLDDLKALYDKFVQEYSQQPIDEHIKALRVALATTTGKAHDAHDLAQAVNKYTLVLESETIPDIINRLWAIEKKPIGFIEEKPSKGIVLFQRNYFKS